MSTAIKAKGVGTTVSRPRRMAWGIALVLLLGVVGFAYWASGTPGGNVLTASLSEPLGGATTARIDVNAGTGNLTIGSLADGGQVLVSGTLQYLESRGAPNRSRSTSNGQATVTLRPGDTRQSWFRLPWAACDAQTDWNIHLNPAVASDITAHSDGGNLKIDLAGMAITRVSADTGGGNVDVVLPERVSNLSATATTGGGNVAVHVPGGIAARIHATSGLGAVVVDPRFSQTDKNTYQSPDFDSAANRVEITAKSGAGNVVVNTK